MCTIRLEYSSQEQLSAFAEMEHSPHTAGFVGSYSLERHHREFRDLNVRDLSICEAEESLAGFIIVVLDPDDISLEFRRIVVTRPGVGVGSYVMSQLRRLCRELGRRRIWLDVYENNDRAARLYEKAEFTQFGSTFKGDRKLLLYERLVSF